MMATTRQIPKISKVNRMRDFSSGILKQLAKLLAMLANMGGRMLERLFSWRGHRLSAGHFAGTAQTFDLFAGRSAESVGTHGQLLLQLSPTQDFDARLGLVRQSQSN